MASKTPVFTKPSESQLADMDGQMGRERKWYKNSQRFEKRSDIIDAATNGQLVFIGGDENVMPVERFRAEHRLDGVDPFLTHRAALGLEAFGVLWRKILVDEYGIDDSSIRVAVTSMVRSQQYQDALVERGALASPNSTHCTGNAFDLDGTTYYRMESGLAVPVGPESVVRSRDEVYKKIGMPNPMTSEGYESRVLGAVIDAAQEMHDAGQINLVREFEGTSSQCRHIAIGPEAEF